jgi:hypothetical protein
MDLILFGGTSSTKLKTKNDTLDPLSVIIKLFIYAHKSVGTKLSIGSNKINIQEPGLFQGTVRKIYGDQKNDVNIIFFPIIFACKYYLGNKKFRARFIHLFDSVIVGSFDKLKETYQGNEIIYNIDQLKSIVQNFVDNEIFDPNTLYSSYDSPGGKIKQGIYSHINTIWNESRLNVVFGMIDEIVETTSEEMRFGLVNGLNTYMGCVDMLTFNLITNL